MKNAIWSLLLMFIIIGCTNDTLTESQDVEKNHIYCGEEIHVCTEMYLPDSLQTPEARAGLFKSKKWTAGQTITIKFMNGSSFLQQKVKDYLNVWLRHANLNFQWVSSSSNAQIRVAFQWVKDDGETDNTSWSYIGKDALSISQNKPTINFGWFTQSTSETEFSRTILHEFGHALGLVHEHQHPNMNIQWDRPYVYSYYNITQNWTREDVDKNVFKRHTHVELNDLNYYDTKSIMHYGYPKEFTLNSVEIPSNSVLSRTDIELIGFAYPFVKYTSRGHQIGPTFAAYLYQFEYLESKNGKYRLYFQPDGNLKLYRVNSGVVKYQIWSTNIGNRPYALFAELRQGNLCIVDDLGPNYSIHWNANAKWPTSYRLAALEMQDDGDIVIHNGDLKSYIAWKSNTAGR